MPEECGESQEEIIIGFRNKKLCCKGSLTVEAAFVLPIFLFVVLAVIYLEKFVENEERLLWAMNRIARESSVDSALTGIDMIKTPVYFQAKGSLYLKNNGLPISFLESGYDNKSEHINVISGHIEKIPFPIANMHTFIFGEKVSTRPFRGVYSRKTDNEDDVWVYVTKHGTVYHKTLSCTHLSLSISEVKFADLEYLRSVGGAKYYPCESCMKINNPLPEMKVFICNYGNRYHSNRACSKMKRSITKVKLSDVGDKLPCSKCGDNNK